MSIPDVLLDTNVASFLLRRAAESAAYRYRIRGLILGVSVITVAELRYGALKKNWAESRTQQLEAFVQGCTTICIGHEIARIVATVMNQRSRAGRRMEWADAWIAATALFHHLPLVTHDRDFFDVDGLEIITELGRFEIREPRVVYGDTLAATAEGGLEWIRSYVTALGSARTLQ